MVNGDHIATRSNDKLFARADCDTLGFAGGRGKSGDLSARLRIPNSRRKGFPIGATMRGNGLSATGDDSSTNETAMNVRAKCDAPYLSFMPRAHGDDFTRIGVPNACRLVRQGGSDAFAICAKSEAKDLTLIPVQAFDFITGCGAPNSRLAIGSASGDLFRVRAEYHAIAIPTNRSYSLRLQRQIRFPGPNFGIVEIVQVNRDGAHVSHGPRARPYPPQGSNEIQMHWGRKGSGTDIRRFALPSFRLTRGKFAAAAAAPTVGRRQ